MATCINKNLSEFKEVANVMGSPILANSLIASWQIFNNSDSIPTVVEALAFHKKTKSFSTLKINEFTEALYANLVREKILTKFKGDYYIVSSQNRIFDPNIRKFNKDRLYNYLRINNINRETNKINHHAFQKGAFIIIWSFFSKCLSDDNKLPGLTTNV